jgi:hypothetical protein
MTFIMFLVKKILQIREMNVYSKYEIQMYGVKK